MKKSTRNNVKTVGVRMPAWMFAALTKIAKREQSGISRLVRLAIVYHYNEDMRMATDGD